ncbi:MAG TPA: TRAP transporter substrate-binding protein [Candidatus Baltobacteraceae bacterium]|nr:TRAP transporter substrate-binding protein [Candidatus Baltobacteraceae bacterium]
MKHSAVGLLLLAVVSMATAAPAQTITMKIGIGHPPGQSFVVASEKFKDTVEKRSNGKLKVDLFPSSQLGGEREMQEMVALGTLEMTVSGVAVIYEPLFALLEAPYLYRDRAHIKKVQASPVVADLGQALLAKGIRLVGFYENGFRHITNSKRPINTPADVKGLKIRTPENLAQLETFKALGAVATPMAFNELYNALSQGVVDGQENPLQNIWTGKMYEVQKHLAMTGHIYNSAYVLVNNKFWTGLPADLHKIAEEAIQEATAFQMDFVANLDKKLLEDCKSKGMQVTTPDLEPFRKATAPAYDVFYAKFGDRGRKIIETIRGM